MVYIAADGNIGGKRPCNIFRRVTDAFLGLQTQWKVIVIVCLAIAGRNKFKPNPLANGKIPAVELNPDQHWERILKDDFFVRSMTEHLHTNRNAGMNQKREKVMKQEKIELVMDLVDFGGPDGHVLESTDWNDVEHVRGTRCSTTSSAITAYFCGAAVAQNQDTGLGHQRKGYNFGVQSFADSISCRHKKQRDNASSSAGNHHHRRSVYRIRIGCRDALAGYSHAFNIIAQPDGSFFWLQSFIGHYSLPIWMENTDAVLSLGKLLAKLEKVKRLMNISGWNSQANADYLELFGVDMEKEAMRRGKPPVRLTWKPDHRLSHFVWDEACEYPVPQQQQQQQQQQEDPTTANKENDGTSSANPSTSINDDTHHPIDECEISLFQNMLAEIKGQVLFDS